MAEAKPFACGNLNCIFSEHQVAHINNLHTEYQDLRNTVANTGNAVVALSSDVKSIKTTLDGFGQEDGLKTRLRLVEDAVVSIKGRWLFWFGLANLAAVLITLVVTLWRFTHNAPS